MSIFNFRRDRPANAKASARGASSRTQAAPESVELVRKRARQRLIGSALLVLIGVVGFPLLFDSQPRPVPVDIPIEIPSRSAVKPASSIAPVSRVEPITALAESEPASQARSQGSVSPLPVPPQASLQGQEEIVEPVPARPKPKAEPKPEPRPETKPKAESKPEARSKTDDGQRAKGLLEGSKTADTDDTGTRVVVQVGAFSEVEKAREARAKLERAGLKTYTQVAETKDGKRIRVRVGPYATKAEADKAAAKIKALNLPAAILTL